MATRLCCSIPSRSSSPEDEPARPLKRWKSFAAIRQTPVSEGQRLLRSTPSQLPMLRASDDLELRRIFVAASLPEDHPDALRLPGRKPSLDDSIIRSPSFTKKIRRQLSRKSLASGKSGTKSIMLGKRLVRPRSQVLRTGSSAQEQQPLDLDLDLSPEGQGQDLGFDPDALSLTLSDSQFASLRQMESLGRSEGPQDVYDMEDRASRNDNKRTPSQRSTHTNRRSVSLPRSSRAVATPAAVRRARSSSSFGDAVLSHPETNQWRLNSNMIQFDASWQISLEEMLHPLSLEESRTLSTVQEQQPLPAVLGSSVYHVSSQVLHDDMLRVCNTDSSSPTNTQPNSPTRPTSQVSEGSVHLYNMQISQHLRSQSQQTDVSSLNDSSKPWNQGLLGHASLNSVIRSSAGSQHLRSMSDTSCASPYLSPFSSIYSRSPSSDIPLPYDILQAIHGPQTPYQINPLNPKEILRDSAGVVESIAGNAPEERHDMPLNDGLKTVDNPEVHSTGGTTPFLTKSDSTISLGRLSKFKEDLVTSPPTKSNRKRRSVLQLLFPKLVKPKPRSISTPALWERTGLATAMFDGPSDDPSRLGVPGQAGESRKPMRSLSLNEPKLQQSSSLTPGDFNPPSTNGITPASLTDYELTLSASGDDRRRKSAIDLGMLRTVQQDNRRESGGQPLRRAAPLSGRGTEGSLMEKALHQHHLEKAALFRSSNKRSNVAFNPAQVPLFSIPFATSAASTPGRVPPVMDELDPLEITNRLEGRKSQSMQQLRPSSEFLADLPTYSRKQSTARAGHNPSTITQRGRCRSAMPLAAWSQYPSHTRERRCGSASREDNVITQDFAYANRMDGDRSSDIEHFDTPSTGKRASKLSVRKSRDWLVKSRSMTFGNVMRYYSNLFTSSAARNRRSSIATSGRLEHPELEVLPPIFPSHPFGLSHYRRSSGSGRLGYFVGHLKEEIKEEGHHLKDEILEEGQLLKDEIKQEGQLLRAETHELFAHHLHVRKRASEESLDPLDPVSPKDVEPGRDSDNDDVAPISPRMPTGLSDNAISPLDGANDGRCNEGVEQPDRAPSARRLSRMYQAYVQLPTSMDAAEGTSPQDTESADSHGGSSLLTIPGHNAGSGNDGTVIRRFPSVTVVDDRKGHWRSISLISAQSGKSLRNSTNDLLDLIVKAKNVEREKLMNAGETPV